MSYYEFEIDQTKAKQRLDVFVGGLPDVVSRSAAARLIDAGNVLVNGSTVAKKYILQDGDFVTCNIVDEKAISLQPENIPLDIKYEDDHILVISKPIGLVCHPAEGHTSGTLVNALIAHCGTEHLGTLQGEDRPGIIHRLDKDTSGLMICCKTNEAMEVLASSIQEHSVDRRYITLVNGNISVDSGKIDASIMRDPKDRTKMKVSTDDKARDSITTFKVLERFSPSKSDDGFTLIECRLFTGRTHQIRVHMHYIKHPCAGDPVYGYAKSSEREKCLNLHRQFLHSYRLSFEHPITKKKLEFVDKLPNDLLDSLNSLANRSKGKTEYGRSISEIYA